MGEVEDRAKGIGTSDQITSRTWDCFADVYTVSS